MTTSKACSRCGVEKCASEFNKKLDKLTSMCKSCLKEVRAESYKRNPESQLKAATDYYRKNKDKVLVKAKARYSSNPEKYVSAVLARKESDKVAFNKRFMECQKLRNEKFPEKEKTKNHNYRAKKKYNGGVLSKDIIPKLRLLQKTRCACCGSKFVRFHLDHIVPLSVGGMNSDDNVQLLCQTCNLQKGKKDPVEFMQSKGFLL